MPIQLYVEQLSEDRTFGYTVNEAMMLFNADKILPSKLKSWEDITAMIFQAGRYVVVVMQDANKKNGMMFFDLNNNRARAEQIASDIFTPETAAVFLKNFEAVSKNYTENYDQVELILSHRFPMDVSEN